MRKEGEEGLGRAGGRGWAFPEETPGDRRLGGERRARAWGLSDGRRGGGPGLRASGSPKSDRNIHLGSVRPPPGTETGPKRKDTARLLGTGGLTLASRPLSDVTLPARMRRAREAGRTCGGA